MKCDLCKEEIERTFLEKIRGTYIKVEGKKRMVCGKCQAIYKDKLKQKL